MKHQGLYTALVTPFDSVGNVCINTLTTLLHKQLNAQVDGITILGTTGEAATLEDEERNAIIKKTVQECRQKAHIMVGISSPSTRKSIYFAKQAQDAGADALLLATPYYNRPTQEGIFLHVKAVAESVSLPICLYNIPSRCGQNIETATLEKLAALDTVVSVKEASGNSAQVQDVIEKIVHKNPQFSLLSGDDAACLAIMALGGHGVVSVISNLLPKTVKKMVTALQQGDIALARAHHYALKPILSACFIETNPIPIKRMLEKTGITVGSSRLPLCMPTRQSEEALDKALSISQHLLDDENL